MGLFDGTPLENLVICTTCGASAKECHCPPAGDSLPHPQWEPSKQPVHVRKEKRARGKVVTVVDGLNGNAQQLQQLLKDLKDYCGAGGTCSDAHVELQGDHTERLRKWLAERGYRIKNAK